MPLVFADYDLGDALLTVLSIFLLADGLRDAFDPHMKA